MQVVSNYTLRNVERLDEEHTVLIKVLKRELFILWVIRGQFHRDGI